MFVVYTHAHTHAHTQTHSCNYAHRVFKICLGEGCSVGHHPAHTSTYKGTYTYIKKRMRMYVCTICTHCIVLHFVVLYCIRLALPTHTYIFICIYTSLYRHAHIHACTQTYISLSLCLPLPHFFSCLGYRLRLKSDCFSGVWGLSLTIVAFSDKPDETAFLRNSLLILRALAWRTSTMRKRPSGRGGGRNVRELLRGFRSRNRRAASPPNRRFATRGCNTLKSQRDEVGSAHIPASFAIVLSTATEICCSKLQAAASSATTRMTQWKNSSESRLDA